MKKVLVIDYTYV